MALKQLGGVFLEDLLLCSHEGVSPDRAPAFATAQERVPIAGKRLTRADAGHAQGDEPRCDGTARCRRILPALLAMAACTPAPDTGPITVSAIGTPPRLRAAPARPLDEPARALTDAVAQGLVRFDAAGQVEPGLAERWIVIDGGRSYIFRLREARWADGTPVDAPRVAQLLARMVRRATNPLAPYLSAVDSVVAMTPQVIEVRLSRPRPDLLKLFAQPELALVRPAAPTGTGPFRITVAGPAPLLRPLPDPLADPDDPPDPRDGEVRLAGERAALGIARFAGGRADLVLGGTFADWPLIATAPVRAGAVRVDPAAGLFGFAIVSRTGFLADAAGRAAVAQAIDRAAATAAVAPAWEPAERLLPDGLDSARPPQVPEWSLRTLAERRAAARAAVARWGRPITLRLALPAGPGVTRLFGTVAASLRSVGVEAVRVAADAAADLRLVDAVAPYDNARWYLATACQPCGAEAEARLEAARLAPTLGERAAQTAAADAAINADGSFITLARPLRWSLVAPGLTAFATNARAAHPLNHLRANPN